MALQLNFVRWSGAVVLALFALNASASPDQKTLDTVTRAAKNFARLQLLVNQHRSIQSPAPGDDSKQMNGDLPVPPEVLNEAGRASEDAATWGCDMQVIEKPKTQVKFMNQDIDIVPFDLAYVGKGCPLVLKAAMSVTNPPDDPDTLVIRADLDFTILDETKKANFGFSHAVISEVGTMKAKMTPTSGELAVSMTNNLASEGGADGPVKLAQTLAFSFNFTAPLSIQASTEDSHSFTINGKGMALKRKLLLNGFMPQAQYWIDDQATDQQTFETTLQGLRYFGLNEEAAAAGGTLACTYSFFDGSKLTKQELLDFETSGQSPASAPSFRWSNCGQSKTGAAGGYAVNDVYDANWLLTTIKGATGSSLQVYFLYDEDSHFVRQIDQMEVLLSCQAAEKCGGGAR